jgi:hypothetical protein
MRCSSRVTTGTLPSGRSVCTFMVRTMRSE